MANIFQTAAKKKPYDIYSGGNTAGNVGTNVGNIWSNPQKSYISAPVSSVQKPQTSYPGSQAAVKPASTNAASKSVVASQPTTNYDTNYQNYLKNRTTTASTLAEQAADEAKRQAQEAYDLEKSGLNTQAGNLKQSLDSYKGNRAEDVNAYNKVVDRNKENARTASGTSQRRLAETRRQTMGQTEKTYANLGTIDSYGTGSFTETNANTDTEFLRMTNENFKLLDDQIFKLDTDAQAYKRQSDEKVQAEESKFNDAVIQINNLLGKNELAKTQAIRQAQQLLASKKAEIQDEYEGLMLKNEKEKVDAQKAIELETAKGQEVANAWKSTSPEFQASGKVVNMNDMMFVNKYKDAYETMLKNSGFKGTGEISSDKQKIIQNIDDVLNSGNLGRISGFQGTVGLWPGSKEINTKGQLEQIKALTTLENRQKLKGQGQISDKETALLEAASNILNYGGSEEQIIDVLKQLRDEMSTGQVKSLNSGSVNMVAPDGTRYTIDQSEVQDAINNGWKQI